MNEVPTDYDYIETRHDLTKPYKVYMKYGGFWWSKIHQKWIKE